MDDAKWTELAKPWTLEEVDHVADQILRAENERLLRELGVKEQGWAVRMR